MAIMVFPKSKLLLLICTWLCQVALISKGQLGCQMSVSDIELFQPLEVIKSFLSECQEPKPKHECILPEPLALLLFIRTCQQLLSFLKNNFYANHC